MTQNKYIILEVSKLDEILRSVFLGSGFACHDDDKHKLIKEALIDNATTPEMDESTKTIINNSIETEKMWCKMMGLPY